MTGALRRLVLRVLAVMLIALGASWALVACTASDPPPPASSDVEAFTFDSLDVDYTLSRAEDGTSRLTVVETFVAVFPAYDQNRGMRRIIPDSDRGVPYHPRLVSITDENGDARASETDSDDGAYAMTSRADDYVHGRQTYVFSYTLDNVTRFFADTDVDEFYWDVNGTEWPQPFGSVSMSLSVDQELAGALTGAASCYVGYAGATDACTISVDGDGADAAAEDLGPHETMTVAVAFEEGTFAAFDPSFLASPWGWMQGVAGLGVLASLVAAVLVRVRLLRDEPGRPTIIAEYTPPPGVDALESAVLLGRTTKAIPAEVLEQAVVGSIRIVEGSPGRLGTRGKLTAQLVDSSRADADGRMLLSGLFPAGRPGEEFEFGRTDTRFSTAAQAILKAATTEIDRRGLRRPVAARWRVLPSLAAIVAATLVFVFGVLALAGGVSALVPVVLIIVSVVVVITAIALVVRAPLTAAGAEVRDHLRGLEQFIEWAEADRIRMLQSPRGAERAAVDTDDPRQMLKLYETLLPYAVVFGQEKEWANQLAALYGPDDSPGWYAGTGAFNAASFASGISTLSSSSSSSSSTSGGSSGGGSAGGGGGGGGGGGV